MAARKKISIFLLDDDALYLSACMRYLKSRLQTEIDIESFENGEDCLMGLEQNPMVDIVILDYYLNSNDRTCMNGLEVLKRIKEYNSDIIVVMLSARDKLEIAEACLRHGAYEYVVKSETAFIRTQNIIKNLIREISLQSYYPQDIGGEGG